VQSLETLLRFYRLQQLLLLQALCNLVFLGPTLSGRLKLRFHPCKSRTRISIVSILIPSSYQAYPQVTAPFQAQGVPAMSSIRSAENAVPSNARYSSRIKIESPSAVALAKRTRDQGEVASGSVSSPSTGSADGDDHVVCNKGPGHLSQSTAKPSPSKSLLSRPSPCKSVAGNKLVQI